MSRQVDIIDQIFANIDYLNDAMIAPLAELGNYLANDQQLQQLKDEDYQRHAKNIVAVVKNLDVLIDQLPPLEDNTPEVNQKIQELEVRNKAVDQKLKEVVGESESCLNHLYAVDETIQSAVINSKN
ncbi:hypothetical protein EIN_275020 [Entamoeba invadens IP1]|uniref:Mediator of RNA polymerase II transcription subunit 21 n=1 Tax=Entamoeba invadens IP1 TaxID=370355 RepID=A0A0A1U1L6_ENTIV|nr:hypothetical protein EIN_275020 [Entamoeba invadens IP1]ELP87915.1 hypothetical protein EIN_275020 [Entamoeba invadens IP1]|eukprot:XP_004254686.1 hypothetical protein EIN_275020 [Entamoeba invadens IP1]